MTRTTPMLDVLTRTGFTLAWEADVDPWDGNPGRTNPLGGHLDAGDAIRAAVEFARTCHADWYGGSVAVRDVSGALVFLVALPLPAFLEVAR